jgi:hypothetical protein
VFSLHFRASCRWRLPRVFQSALPRITEERLDTTELGTLIVDVTASRFVIKVPAPAILLSQDPQVLPSHTVTLYLFPATNIWVCLKIAEKTLKWPCEYFFGGDDNDD